MRRRAPRTANFSQEQQARIQKCHDGDKTFGLWPRPTSTELKRMKTHKFAISSSSEKCCGCDCSRKTKRVAICAVLTPFLVLGVLVAVLLIRASTIASPFQLEKLDREPKFMNMTPSEKEDRARILAEAIRFPTVSYNKTYTDPEALSGLHEYLKTTFAEVFKADFIQVNPIHEYSLLLRVEGQFPTRNPYLLCGHLDVVPEGTGAWTRPPFSGEIFTDDSDGEKYIFGRGAIDDKQSVIGILESLNYMILENHRPNRTFYVAFGHDEEVGGDKGAGYIAQELKNMLDANGEELSFILDEGMFVMDGVFPGVSDPVAYIGVVEKGWAEFNISVSGTQGHSSIPPRESSIGILSKAISNLEENRQPSRFGEAVEYDTMSYVGPYASFGYKVILNNLWLFKPIVSSILSNDAATDAIQRTTTAVTIVRGGFKNNVVPSEASALINHRIHPADNVESVEKHDVKAMDDDRVKITLTDNFPPTKVSPYNSSFKPFQIIANSIIDVFPNAALTPGTLVANTDTKHYLDLCDAIYRFQPVRLKKSDVSRFHGVDERISVENFNQVIQFYYRLIRNADFDLETGEANNDDIFEALSEDAPDFLEDTFNATEAFM